MIGLVLFLLSSVVGTWLYWSWQLERKQRLLNLSHTVADVPSRQSMLYQQSSLFHLLSYAGQDELGTFRAFTDRFNSLDDVSQGMKRAGIERCGVILGIDFTASNEWQGRKTFRRLCLHALLVKGLNPYQRVITILGDTLAPFVVAGSIHAFGFGDQRTRNRGVFSFNSGGTVCSNFKEVLQRYNSVTKSVCLAGPTSFAPIITKAVQIVKSSGKYHMLIIISDGQMRDERETVDALICASYFPLSIIMVGIGDGPWNTMEIFDDLIPRRKFDNFQFVDYNKAFVKAGKNPEAYFALHALMEVPDQYKCIKQLGYL